MLDGNRQIVAAFENAGMSANDIAADLGLSVEAVKLTLLNESAQYRKLFKKEEEDVSADEMKEMFRVLIDVARHELDHPGQRVKAAKYLIDERKGRNDFARGRNTNINVNLVDARLKRAKIALKKTIEIDVKGEVVKQPSDNNQLELLDVAV